MIKQIVFAILVVAALQATAQNLTKHGVLRLNVRSFGPIIQDDQVRGYYFFYNVDKRDPQNNTYLLSLYDENLREVNTEEIIRPKTYTLIDGVFNGEAFAFLFFDFRARRTELVTYDRSLKRIGNVIRLISNKSMLSSYRAIVNGAEASQAFVVPLTNKGFLYYGLRDDSKFKYEIHCYSNELKVLWSDLASTDAAVEVAAEGFQSGDYVGSMVSRKARPSSKHLEIDLMVNRISTGEKLFSVPMVTDQYSLTFSDVFFDEGKQNFVVFGEYNYKDAKELKAPSLGFMTLTLDMTGKIVGEKLNSWAKEISMAAPVNERGQFDGNNSRILFHQFVRTDDGRIFAIGEQYKKAANAAGIVGNVLMTAAGGGAAFSNAQLNIYNMVIFEFAPDYSLVKVNVFEKDKNVVTLPAGFEYLSPRLVSYYAKAIGGFDYAFTQRAPDKSTFHVSYVSYDREKGQAARNVLGSIVYTPEKTFVVDKIDLDRRSSLYFVNRAKDGYVMVTEYFRKEKRVDSRLEKINY